MVFVGSLADAAVALDPGDAHHLSRVLRLRSGEVVIAADGRGSWRSCTYTPTGTPAGPGLVAAGEVQSLPLPAPPVAVGFVPTKGDRPEWVVQKLTELGVDRIVVVASGRSVVRWDRERGHRHLDKLREVARQAAMQSRRPWLPTVEGVVALSDLAGGSPLAAESFSWSLAVPGGPPPALPIGSRGVGVLIGPEGGWTPEEESLGFPAVGLGDGVLRAETAAVAAGTVLGALRAGLVTPAEPGA
jgi:16S rRNA (uracil1498-N3)-methyltransferase